MMNDKWYTATMLNLGTYYEKMNTKFRNSQKYIKYFFNYRITKKVYKYTLKLSSYKTTNMWINNLLKLIKVYFDDFI